jgi:ubiquinone biosynthesis protein
VPDTVLLQDLNHIRQIGVIAARHGFGEMAERAGLWRILGRREKVEVSPELQRASTARRFRLLLNDLGPTFVKLGQILSTRADLLPAEFVEELSTLQDHVDPIPLEEVHAQIREALGREVEELFQRIDPGATGGGLHRPGAPGGDARGRRGGGEGAAAGARRAD